jgi:predicted PurR-regulated permease PerM
LAYGRSEGGWDVNDLTDQSEGPAGQAATDGAVPTASKADHDRALRIITFCVAGLLLLAVLYTLHAARTVLLPVATAILLSFPLRPIPRLLERIHIPQPVGAGLVVLLLGGALGYGVYSLSGPAAQWIREAPDALRQVEYRLRVLAEPVEEVQRATKSVEELRGLGDEDELEVVVKGAGLDAEVLQRTRSIAANTFITLLILFFFLGWGNLFFRNLVSALPGFHEQRQAVVIIRDIEEAITTYLGTVTLINAILGVVVAGVLYLLGVPNAVLWGVVAGLLNYIPYLGPMITMAILTFVGLLSFPTLGEGLLPAALFLIITSLEGQIITPMAVGHRLTINPLLIFTAVFFWFWIWGVIGALLTVPILVCVKIVLDRMESTRGVGMLMGH